jgi:hypothetical protein
LKYRFIDGFGGPNEQIEVNKTKAVVRAFAWSAPFHVIPAKKFPGVVKTTGLNRKFQGQGIKLSVRRDKGEERGDDETPVASRQNQGESDDDE